MAQTDGRQRTKSGHNDDIAEGAKTLIIIPPKDPTEIKPPIDLIPDEFPRERNGNVLVELVYGENDRNAKNLKECLTDLEYCVTETDKDRQKMHQHIDEKWVNGVFTKINENNYDGLIMIFAKVGYRNADITQLWSKFTSQTCPKLKNKPKIFIFQIVQRSAVDHTATSLNWPTGYETPAQADLLIIHDIYDPDTGTDLLGILTQNINEYGCQEDILNLISIGSGERYQPLAISTMTRKFFFKSHDYRGHHYNIIDTLLATKKQLGEELKQQRDRRALMEKKVVRNSSPSKRVNRTLKEGAPKTSKSAPKAPWNGGQKLVGKGLRSVTQTDGSTLTRRNNSKSSVSTVQENRNSAVTVCRHGQRKISSSTSTSSVVTKKTAEQRPIWIP